MGSSVVVIVQTIVTLLPLALEGFKGAKEIIDWASDLLKNMIKENRDPTNEEWQELITRRNALSDLLQSDDK